VVLVVVVGALIAVMGLVIGLNLLEAADVLAFVHETVAVVGKTQWG
jgi:hypothetical protein